MRVSGPFVAGGIAAIVVVQAAAAQDRPTWPPARDVTVTYALVGMPPRPGQPTELTIAFAASPPRMRIDVGPRGYILLDLATREGRMVVPQRHMVMTMPPNAAPPARMLDFNGATNVAREGADTVAGMPCTVWKMTRPGSIVPGEACLTDDGTLLRARGGGDARDGNGGMVAKSVSYDAIPASAFEVPAGFTTMTAPTGGMSGRQGPPPRP